MLAIPICARDSNKNGHDYLSYTLSQMVVSVTNISQMLRLGEGNLL
jgi:hypothetical protein